MSRAFSVLAGWIVLLAVNGCCLCRPDPIHVVDEIDKYAVLVSTEMSTTNDVGLNAEFWYDLVLTYCTLLDQGFKEDNIYVLYGKGVDATSIYDDYSSPYCDGNATTLTDYPLWGPTFSAKDNVCNVLCCLSTGYPAKFDSAACECRTKKDKGIGGFSCVAEKIPRLKEQDFLVSWIKGHGSSEECDIALGFYEGTDLLDDELQTIFKDLRPKRWALLMETCDAGGWIDEYENRSEASVMVSSGDPTGQTIDKCVETSYPATYKENANTPEGFIRLLHGRFTYWVNASIRQADLFDGEVASDSDRNNLVSIIESFSTVSTKIGAENTATDPVIAEDIGGPMHPAISSQTGTSECVFIRLPVPGIDHEIFAMDHEKDDGVLASTLIAAAAVDSPDLWVSNTPGGPSITSPAISGQGYFVNARVFNVGCDDPSPVEVMFQEAPAGACDDANQWTQFGHKPAPNLPVAGNTVVSTPWTATQGEWCLIGVWSANGDPPNDQGIASDNNKVRTMIEAI